VFITEFVCLSACVEKKIISDTRSISKSIHNFVPSEIPDNTLIDNECDLKKLEIIQHTHKYNCKKLKVIGELLLD